MRLSRDLLKFLWLIPLTLFVSVSGANALSIDEFDGIQVAESTGAAPIAYANLSTATAIGGKRGLNTTLTGGSLRLTLETDLSVLNVSQDAGVTGNSVITWDGDDDAANLTTDGLGGVDLAQDTGDRFIMKVVGFDPGQNGTPINLVFTVYDASNSTHYSSATVVFNTALADHEIEIPFASFTQAVGAAAPASFANVGAITLEIFGTDPAMDLTLDWIRTNGVCVPVPDPLTGLVIDDCGICRDNNLFGNSKDDCDICVGDPGYNEPRDDCDLCPNDPNYQNSKDDCDICIGEPGYNEPKDDCDLCPNDPNYQNSKDQCDFCIGDPNYNQPLDTCGLCIGDPNYQNAQDDCGVCFGNNRDLDDCGICGGNNASKDACGICGGDGSSCADCLGNPNGNAVVDVCGVCDGDGTSCLDCAGTPFGVAVFDSCGECDGDGTVCADCAGTPFGVSVSDRCNVCDGDGSSCLGCEGYDQSELLGTMDGKAKDQERIIKQITRKLKRVDKSAKAQKFATNAVERAAWLQNRNWILSWSLPVNVNLCTNQVFCTSSSNMPILDEYRVHARELLQLTKKAAKRFSKARGKRGGYERKMLKRAARFYDEALALANQVPTEQDTCS